MAIDLDRVIEEDLYNELRYMLCSAAIWKNADTLEVPHLKVFTMDSCFLHARALYGFLKKSKDKREISWDNFSKANNTSNWPENYEDAINTRLMHINKDRPNKDPIKDEVVNVAKATLRIWDEFWAGHQINKRFVRIAETIRNESVRQANTLAKDSDLKF